MNPEQVKKFIISARNQNIPDEQITSYLKNKGVDIAKTQPEQPSTISKVLQPASDAVQGLKTLYGGGEQGIANKLKEDIQAGAQDIQKGDILKGIAKSGGRTAGDVIGAVFAPVGAALQATGIPKALDYAGQKIAESSPINAITNIPAVQEFAIKHPNAAEDFNRVLNIIMAGGESSKIQPETAIPRTVEQVSPIISDIKTAGKDLYSNSAQELTNIANEAKAKIPSRENIGGKAPEAIMQRVARINPSEQVKFQSMTKLTPGEYLTKNGIYGEPATVAEKLIQRVVDNRSRIDATLEKLPGRYNDTVIGTMLNDVLAREIRTSPDGAPSPDLATVKSMKTSFDNGGLSALEINNLKRMFERKNTMDYALENNSEKMAGAQNLDSAVRELLFKKAKEAGFSNLDKINKDTQAAKTLADAIHKKAVGSSANNIMGLTDWIVLAGADPTSVAGFFSKKLFSSPGFQSWVAKNISNIQGRTPASPILPEVGMSTFKQLPAPSGKPTGAPISLPGETTFEPAAKSVRKYSKPQLMLPSPNGNSQGVPIALPSSAYKTNLGM